VGNDRRKPSRYFLTSLLGGAYPCTGTGSKGLPCQGRSAEGSGQEHGERNLIRTDPESEAFFDQMKTLIADEILARIQVNDRGVDDPEWLDGVSAMSADRLLGTPAPGRRSSIPLGVMVAEPAEWNRGCTAIQASPRSRKMALVSPPISAIGSSSGLNQATWEVSSSSGRGVPAITFASKTVTT
jgi:hypothetical protein